MNVVEASYPLHFAKVTEPYQETLFHWLLEPHVQEFWDNSEEHKEDILNFIQGRVTPSNYCDGLYTYWIGFVGTTPYCMIMTLKEEVHYAMPALKKSHLSKLGSTYSMDYMIGNKEFLGKGLGAKTLDAFLHFFRHQVDIQADTFFIDPDVNNPRARHVYEQAGFQYVGDFIMEGEGVFAGHKTHFLLKQLPSRIQVIEAKIIDYPIVQNMARFYIYDRASFMNWECAEDGSFHCMDLGQYFILADKKAYLVRVDHELAGFVLLDKDALVDSCDWNFGEFFIFAKFQGKGVAHYVCRWVFSHYPGRWAVAVMQANIKALKFWKNVVEKASGGKYLEVFKSAEELRAHHADPYDMIVFSFMTINHF